ncbi:MAG TPA: putative toxin-antitoxin system toxin component, PIN family [Syntrophales bacterium]|nr:putative toxin-antitoxin system toxin component, PIN family [Syntrophales bacterium]HQB29941.1 putative toxin-antitoxin system toxin component, PIN family [Syntrophales bacterium]HQN79007.1 putative toxin-antitoxin system toxin component, PIN family [Syntrophales bacterium]HQQ26029.1 putative toxin-antitoxin system toxin component, PIN family [Syntrophales bacterium]
MRIVLDTNVLVAGLLSPFGPCGDIVRMVSSGNPRLCIDARILSEYREVLERPKFGFDREKTAVILDEIAHHGWVVTSSPLSVSLPDPDDMPFLEVAIAGGADCLVTGNGIHFPPGMCQGMGVVSPADFLKRVARRKQSGRGISKEKDVL